jgi:MurNAc alpha-1-phosphate uridylyltransferase
MPAMILAAGRGERLRPVTDSTPKAMVEVRGQRMIDRHLEMMARAGIHNVVINLGWLGEQIADHVGSGDRYGVNVIYSPEYDNVLETGGGIVRALPMLGSDPFWVVNADIYTDYELPDRPLADELLAELVLVPRPAHRKRGDFALVDGLTRNAREPGFTFSGIARYRPAFFDGRAPERFSVAPMLREAADKGVLGGTRYDGSWEDVGTSERLAFLNQR